MIVAHRRAPRPARRGPVRRGERGSVLTLVAVSLSVIVICTALTVDLGRVSTLRRELQNVADAAALDLVRLVDGRTAAAILGDAEWDATLASSLDRNGFERDAAGSVTVQLGRYDAVADVFTVAGPTEVPSAVAVTAADRVEHQFTPGSLTTSRRAVAAQTASAGIQVGSFAARLDSGRSALLNPLIGRALRVDGVSYTGLAGARVALADLATELDLSLASPSQLLATELDVVDLVAAQAAVLRRAGDTARASILEALALRIPPSLPTVALGDLIAIGTGGAAAAATATLDVLELLATTALVATGDRAIDIPGLTLGVPGVAAVTTTLHVVESPRIAYGGPGTSVRTAQVGLQLGVDLSAAGLVGARLSVAVAAAPATATIRDVSCGEPMGLGLDVTTGLATTDASVAARIAVSLLGLVNVPVADAAAVATGGRAAAASAVDLAFPPDELGVPVTISSQSLGLSDLSLTPTLTLLPSSQLPALLRTVLGLVTSTATGVVGTVLTPLVASVLGALDAVVVQPLLGLLGVTVPGADVTPLAVRCTGPRLVG